MLCLSKHVDKPKYKSQSRERYKQNGYSHNNSTICRKVQRILDDGNSAETSRFCKGRKRARDSDEPLDDGVTPVMQLTDNKSHIFHKNKGVSSTVSPTTWSRYIRKDFPHYKYSKRKLDMCKKCLQWDHRVVPSAKAFLVEWQTKFSLVFI